MQSEMSFGADSIAVAVVISGRASTDRQSFAWPIRSTNQNTVTFALQIKKITNTQK